LKLPHLSKQNGQEKSSVTGMKGLMNHIRNRVVQGKERNKKKNCQPKGIRNYLSKKGLP
jgi:hypothetical protein